MQEAFRGVLVCQGPGNRSLPGKAHGFRGQDTVERHDGLSVVMEKIDQWEQENPASNGREMIDDFRLRGSNRCRQMGRPLSDGGGWRSNMAAILLRTTPFSQRAEPSPVWFWTFPKRRIRSGTTRIPRVGCGKAKRGCASRVPSSPGATARRTRGVLVVRATPPY